MKATAKAKICPNSDCRLIDSTDFSTCRRCGHKYDGSTEKSVSALACLGPVKYRIGPIIWLAVLLVIGGGCFSYARVDQKVRVQALEGIRTSIIAADRPRAIVVMQNWQAPGQSYVTTVNNEQERRGKAIDFCKVSSDDPANKDIVDKLAVEYTPYTAIFDRNGKEVKTISGDLSQEDLDTYLVKAMIVGKKPVVVQVKKMDQQHPAKMAPGNEIRMAFNKLATH